MRYKVGFVGCGNMASAMIEGLFDRAAEGNSVECGGLKYDYEIFVYDKDLSKVTPLCERLEIRAANSCAEIASVCDIIILCVKPDSAEIALKEIGQVSPEKILISIMAGKKISFIKKFIGCKVVRAMPNLAAKIGGSMTAFASSDLDERDDDIVSDVLKCAGFTVNVREEDMDAVTAISGSGIAYVYMFIDALTKAGEEMGLTHEAASSLVTQTFAGGAAMCMINEYTAKKPVSKMIDDVCSKGGTTIEAVNILKDKKIEDTIKLAAKAAYEKSKQLSEC